MTPIIRRSATSITWLGTANAVSIVVLLAKSILLARLLPIEVFGVYALATSIITASSPLVQFGMGSAFLFRHRETEDEAHAAAVHFTLKITFTAVWTTLLLLAAAIFYQGEVRSVMIWLVLTLGAQQAFLQTPRLILVRRVAHKRPAVIQFVSDILGAFIGIALAAGGAGIWALISANVVNLLVALLLYYVVKPVWRPRLKWSASAARHFVGYGGRVVAANFLLRLLDTLDDMWTGFLLGSEQLGFYSRAYRFATYPRQFIARPVNRVILGTYAALKDQRLQLSQAFFRSNALVIRVGFLLSGLLALIAPEMIRLLLTEKWLPMLLPFRLMLLFTLLDPIKLSVGHLFVAVGQPGKLIRVRTIQLIVLIAGLALLSPSLGIAGVALATNAMLLVGIAIMLSGAKEYVDYSLRQLTFAPAVALLAGFLAGYGLLTLIGQERSDLLVAASKGIPFAAAYLGVLIALEGKRFRDMILLALLPSEPPAYDDSLSSVNHLIEETGSAAQKES